MGVEPASVRACVRPSVRALIHSNINVSATKRPIAIKFYLKHHCCGEKAALGFGLDRIRTLVCMATDNGENLVSTLASSFLIGSSSYLQKTRTTIISQTSSNFGQI